jgi:hypothetical protein
MQRMSTAESLRTEIEAERMGRRGLPAAGLLELIRQGKVAQAIEELLYLTPPKEFRHVVGELEQALLTGFESASAAEHAWSLEFVTDLATRLASFCRSRFAHTPAASRENCSVDLKAADLTVWPRTSPRPPASSWKISS